LTNYSFNERFWTESDRWPGDPVGYVFLPRALAKIERSLCSEALQMPADLAADADDAAFDAHEDAMEEYEKKTIERRILAVNLLVSGCKNGKLVCATRPKLGGGLSALDPSIWNTERYHHWFVYCDLAPDEPYDDADAEVFSEDRQWLFVSNDSLATFTKPAIDVQRNRHLSPYMSLMISVIDELGISRENQPEIKVLTALFMERWRNFGPADLSDRLAKAMATLVRDWESRAGGNPKTKNKKG